MHTNSEFSLHRPATCANVTTAVKFVAPACWSTRLARQVPAAMAAAAQKTFDPMDVERPHHSTLIAQVALSSAAASVAATGIGTLAAPVIHRRGSNLWRQRAWCQAAALAGLALGLWGSAQAQVSAADCGPIWGTQQQFGPLDYRKSRATLEKWLEPYHFTPEVEYLIRSKTGSIGGDLFYVLRAVPNHHRALISAARLAKRLQNPQPQGMVWPIECSFERATRFAPDDIVVRGLYAQWLGEAGRRADAERQLETALLLAKDDPISNYSIGLVYLELGAHEQALAQAHRAQQLGWTKPGLAEKLKQVGKWKEPANESQPAEPAAKPP